jgi:hypothetical protein
MPKPMSLPSRRDLLGSIRQRYRAASRKDKQRILDEFIAASGYHRKLIKYNHLVANCLILHKVQAMGS